MNRIISLFVCFIFAFIPVQAVVVTGGVEYNQERAAEEVFRTPPKTINFNFISSHFVDINYSDNISALKAGIKALKDRRVGSFSDGTYGVIYYDDPLFSWYYSSNGRLVNFTERSSSDYPCKITKYKPDGTVANTGLKVSENESYIFSSQGKLLAHWVGNFCYDEENNVIMTRKTVE
ncbi:hypothetical protein IKQ21_01685 [bacterium]|nr:hypothetical protein [bacterium]